MNRIDYQPTGVYSGFALNPALLANEGNTPSFSAVQNQPYKTSLNSTTMPAPNLSSSSQNSVAKEERKKMSKTGKGLMILAIATLAIFGVGKFSKGVRAIKAKEATFGEAASLDQFFKDKGTPQFEQDALRAIWDKGLEYQESIIGKIHSGFQAVGRFFKDHFYNY